MNVYEVLRVEIAYVHLQTTEGSMAFTGQVDRCGKQSKTMSRFKTT